MRLAMRLLRKSAFVLLFLLLAGLVRSPLERPLSREMRAMEILPAPLDQATSQALGQNLAAISLGGLRSLVATVLNFSKVIPAWQEQDWVGIFTTFEQIHTLQPKVRYYWQAAASWAADDAYSDYRDRPGVEEWQRALRRNEFFLKGMSYLDEGIKNLPNDLCLRELKARMLSDPFKPEHVDYAAATAVLDEAVKLPQATPLVQRQHSYLMARVPARRPEALALTRKIYADPQSRFPSIKVQLFALQNEFPDSEALPLETIYPTKADAVASLFNHYQRREEALPMTGVHETLVRLLSEINPPLALNPLLNPDLKRVTPLITEVLAACPLYLPDDPFAEESSWPLVVELFEEHGPEGLPTIGVLYFVLQNLAAVPVEKRVPVDRIFKNRLFAIRDAANFLFDESHNFPTTGVRELLVEQCAALDLPPHLSPLSHPERIPWTTEWMDQVRNWQLAP